MTQAYGYDSLNRLTSMNEGAGGPSQTYGYTGSHNMYVASNDNTTFAISAFTPTGASNFDGVSNRLGINNATYDTSGIGTQTAMGGYTNVYDAENRLTTSKLTASVGFSYDGMGQRVQKINCPGGDNPCLATSPKCGGDFVPLRCGWKFGGGERPSACCRRQMGWRCAGRRHATCQWIRWGARG